MAESQLAALRAQLAAISSEAIEVIEYFHGPAGWKEYQHSPEMKRFRAALRGAANEETFREWLKTATPGSPPCPVKP